jgi:1,3-beta-glucan synthase
MLEKLRNDNGNNTDNGMNIFWTLCCTLPYLIMALAAASRIDIHATASSANSPLRNG